jgi:ribosome recycling factor
MGKFNMLAATKERRKSVIKRLEKQLSEVTEDSEINVKRIKKELETLKTRI